MRVLFVSQELPPETGWGGIGTYVETMSRTLADKGVEVHVLSVVEGQPTTRRTLDGVTVHRFPLPRARGPAELAPESWHRLALPATVARLIGTLPAAPTVVECPDWSAEGLGLALTRRVPLVVRLHSSARQLFPYTGQGLSCFGLDGKLAIRLEEATLRRANVVASPRSNLEQVQTWMHLDEDALHAIPNAVRLPPYHPYPNGGERRVVFVGRLETRKAPDILLRAAPKVLAAAPDTRFVFIGRDAGDPDAAPASAWLKREAERLGIGPAVEFRGELDWNGVAEELGRASVCAFPSRWECFPNVAAEASAVGRPVVVSSIPAFGEMVQDGTTGRVAASDRPDDWAQSISELLLDPARAEAFGDAGSAHIRRVSDPARLADLALAAYEHAIERWRRRQRAGRRALASRRPTS